MKKQLNTILILTISIFYCSTFGYADDWQYWSAYNFKVKVTESIDFILNPSIRLRDNISKLFC